MAEKMVTPVTAGNVNQVSARPLTKEEALVQNKRALDGWQKADSFYFTGHADRLPPAEILKDGSINCTWPVDSGQCYKFGDFDKVSGQFKKVEISDESDETTKWALKGPNSLHNHLMRETIVDCCKNWAREHNGSVSKPALKGSELTVNVTGPGEYDLDVTYNAQMGTLKFVRANTDLKPNVVKVSGQDGPLKATQALVKELDLAPVLKD